MSLHVGVKSKVYKVILLALLSEQLLFRALFQNPVMPVIILDADFTDLRICCLKFASIGVNRILKITGK